MLSSKHFLFINMLLFYIEDKNHFLKKINFNWMKDQQCAQEHMPTGQKQPECERKNIKPYTGKSKTGKRLKI